ncbi:MAG: cytochrome c [Rhodoferax sp.]|nr:cytochrome c [Rhodoferax sp.]
MTHVPRSRRGVLTGVALGAAAAALLALAGLANSGLPGQTPVGAMHTPVATAVGSSSPATGLADAFYARPAPLPARALQEPELTGSLLAADEKVVRGQYLARMGGCIGCHSRPGGAPFAGGLPLQTPFGVIVSTNITPDKTQGIGNYTLATFDAALRHGKDAEGGNLYPAMPYVNFARMTEDDIAALFSYFMQAVPAAQQDNPDTALAWPFSMKSLLSVWNWLYLPRPGFVAEAQRSADWNRGAYLVRGAGHCGACHTPRGVSGAEKSVSEQDGDQYLEGALIDGWYAQSLRSMKDTQGRVSPGLERWSVADIEDYLRSGRNGHTAAFGAMSAVVAHTTQHLTAQDGAAIAIYLKSVGSGVGASSKQDIGINAPSSATDLAVADHTSPATAPDVTTQALRAGIVSRRGAAVYLNNCSGCHRSDGRGAARIFPGLALSSSVAAADATSLIRIVLQGSAMPSTASAPSALAMPGLGWRLSDDDVAGVLSFVRNSWGNKAGGVTAADVAKVRAAVQPQVAAVH